jgi:hypothetical protein
MGLQTDPSILSKRPPCHHRGWLKDVYLACLKMVYIFNREIDDEPVDFGGTLYHIYPDTAISIEELKYDFPIFSLLK